MSDRELAEAHSIRRMLIRLTALAKEAGHLESELAYSNSAVRRGFEIIDEQYRRLSRP